MLAKRIIPCLDVKNNQVVKGVQFRQHQIVGEIVDLAQRYAEQGADELVFYDISAASEQRVVDKQWVSKVAQVLDIPFCVAGGISSIDDARQILANGADKISINSPALANPDLINQLADQFGRQCIVVGIDSYYDAQQNDYYVYQYTGDLHRSQRTQWKTADWLQTVQQRGAGEIVLNMMNQDGVKGGYDLVQLQRLRPLCQSPLIASGGAGQVSHFVDVFKQVKVDGALAASVFHHNQLTIPSLKQQLHQQGVCVRLC